MRSLVATLEPRIGQEVAISPWRRLDQGQIDQFAAISGDEQWIHVDAARAGASPFGATIVHGFLTLALLSGFMHETFAIEGAESAINYGLNRVRFLTPVRCGSRVRGRFVPLAVISVAGGVQVTWRVTVELEGAPRAAAVAEWIVRYVEERRPASVT
ncbi:MAG: MaoC family dehydratase [Vicinamibacterales bacterium]